MQPYQAVQLVAPVVGTVDEVRVGRLGEPCTVPNIVLPTRVTEASTSSTTPIAQLSPHRLPAATALETTPLDVEFGGTGQRFVLGREQLFAPS
ncbi:hypothetical protein [Kitasatospora phosalacinea]|uniref:hypothetical protein n=1 Tax=Kitasatospora phosalacinea TaxID=2065 RepID=UPI002554B2EF|nr:hypothetical protein [Kitasatospora phosalacinea]